MKSYSKNLIFCQAQVPYEDLGDLVLTKILLMILRNYGRLIVNDKKVPEWYCQQLGLTADERASKYVLNFNVLVLLFRIKSWFEPNVNTYLIMRPGHFFGHGFLNSIKILMSATYCLILKIIGVRICRFGTSINHFSKVMQVGEKWKSTFMYFYSVRDSISQHYALTMGINKVKIFPDMAWFIKKHYTNENLVDLMQMPNSNQKQPSIESDYVVFSFRDTFREFNNSEYKDTLCTVLDDIVKLVCGEWSQKLVICYQVTWDHKFCKFLSERYQDYCEVVFIEHTIDTCHMYSLYAGATMVFSNRLHVLMFAMLCNSLPIAVVDANNEHKITGIFSDAGLMRLIIDIGKGSSGVKVLPRLANDASLIKEEIASCFDRNFKYGEALLRCIMTGETPEETLQEPIHRNSNYTTSIVRK